jgi:hypothetical protein
MTVADIIRGKGRRVSLRQAAELLDVCVNTIKTRIQAALEQEMPGTSWDARQEALRVHGIEMEIGGRVIVARKPLSHLVIRIKGE